MFVCKLDEAVGDVSPSVETNYLGLHVPTGRLKQRERRERSRLTESGGNSSLHKTFNFPRDLANLCAHQAFAAMTG